MTEEILPGIQLLDLAVYIQPEDCLIVSDLQLGYESHLTRKGVLVPRFNYNEVVKRLNEKIFSKKNHYKKMVVNGDLKHEFGPASEQEWKEVTEFLEFLKPHCDEILIIRGNHDIALDPLGKWSKMKIEDCLLLEEEKILICHGHQIPDKNLLEKSKIIIIGHDHPAVTLIDGHKRESYKAFYKVKWKDKQIVILPSFNFLTIGSDLRREKPLSPFFTRPLKEFDGWLVEDRVYHFGTIKNEQRAKK